MENKTNSIIAQHQARLADASFLAALDVNLQLVRFLSKSIKDRLRDDPTSITLTDINADIEDFLGRCVIHLNTLKIYDNEKS